MNLAKGYDWHHLSTFFVTFVGYSLFHLVRKTLSNVKSTVILEWRPFNDSSDPDVFPNEIWNRRHLCSDKGDCEAFAGGLDTAFLLSYSLGVYIFGILGDRVDVRYLLLGGSVFTTTSLLLFAFIPLAQDWYSRPFLICMWIAFGFSHGTGFPSFLHVLGNWFKSSHRGTLMGLWGASKHIGNIASSYLAAEFLPNGFEFPFLVNGSLALAGGILIWFALVPSPDQLKSNKSEITNESNNVGKVETIPTDNRLNICQAVMLPGVISCTCAYVCLKLVDQSIFYWLPNYLTDKFDWTNSQSDLMATWYDWGGLVGGILLGIATDLFRCRSPFVCGAIVAAVGLLAGYSQLSDNQNVNGGVVGLVGFCVGGANTVLSGPMVVDMGHQRNSKAVGTVTGIVDGTGSVITAVGQTLIATMQDTYDWTAVFYLLVSITALSTICLTQLVVKDVKRLCANRIVNRSI